MSGLALTRLIITGDAASRRRLAGIIAGVMVGVALFLLLAAASQAFGVRSERSTWTHLQGEATSYTPGTALTPDTGIAASALDHARGRLVNVVILATTQDTHLRVPGSDVVPRPGQYLASPAMAELIDSLPADQLADRYGQRVGLLSDDALEGPDSLVLVAGAQEDEVLSWTGQGEAKVISGFAGFDFASAAYRIVAIIGALAVLIPVLLLIAIVTDLGAAQRAERFATLRLIGATPGRVARIAAAETAVTSALGAVLGIGLHLAAAPLAAGITIGSSRFYVHDLLASPALVAGTVLAVVAGAAALTWWRALRADVGPLGAIRERRERAPRTVSVLPLIAGLAGLACMRLLKDAPVASQLRYLAFIGSFLLTMLGLLWAGPLLTSWVVRAAQRRARTSAQVISLGRLAQHPRAAFRAVGGLVVAVYAVTLFAVAITAAAGVREVRSDDGRLDPHALYAPVSADARELESITAQLEAVEGVTVAAVAHHEAAQASGEGPGIVLPVDDARSLGAKSAASQTGWVRLPELWLVWQEGDPRPAPAPATGVGGSGDGEGTEGAGGQGQTGASPTLIVATGSDPAAVDRARTAMINRAGVTSFPTSRTDNSSVEGSSTENQFAALGYIGIIIAAAISAVSLAAATVSSLLARRRVLSLLHLVGMPHDILRRVAAYETLIPVGTVLAVSITAGVYTAWMLISGLSQERSIGWPRPSYYLVLGACLVFVSVAVAGSTRAAARMVSGTTVRFE